MSQKLRAFLPFQKPRYSQPEQVKTMGAQSHPSLRLSRPAWMII